MNDDDYLCSYCDEIINERLPFVALNGDVCCSGDCRDEIDFDCTRDKCTNSERMGDI